MQYRLYENSANKYNDSSSNLIDAIIKNRGIDDSNKYLHLDQDVIIPFQYLDNIYDAAELFMKHFNSNNKIGILVDTDVDGYCSGSMMYSYVKRMNKDYPVYYILHKRAKTHGLTNDIDIPNDIKLLIIPDAGTNDKVQIKSLNKIGIDVIILDHHELEKKYLKYDDKSLKTKSQSIIVNNQISDKYFNKELCGAGVVYKFLQALDELNWNEYADDYLDLCALANISDVMDLRSFETRYLVNIGLQNIKNKLFNAMINAQEYSMSGKINIHNVQWYITPVINGMLRVGSIEEKELLFKAFIEQDDTFEYKKRATKNKPAEIILENIYDRAARLCKNAKSRQDKLRDKGVVLISDVVKLLPEENKIIIIDVTDMLDGALTGLVAIKIAEQFNKPCILLKQFTDDNEKIVFGGSARNIDHSPISNLKNVVNSSGVFNYGQGHANAFGVNLDLNKIDKAQECMNEILKDVEYDSTYYVDFILNIEEVSINIILELSHMDNIICQGIDEPMIAVENIILARDQFEILGKKEDTISFIYNGIKYIQFKCTEENELYNFLQNAWSDENKIHFNIVGKPSLNEYDGIVTPQIIIEDVNVNKIYNDDSALNDDLDDEW